MASKPEARTAWNMALGHGVLFLQMRRHRRCNTKLERNVVVTKVTSNATTP
jgi:hypothetical protein